MEQLIKSYLDWKGTYAPRASVMYKIWLNRFIEVCGDKPLEAYGVADFVTYHQWLSTRYNPCTVQYATIIIKNFLVFCRTQGHQCFSSSLIRLPRGVAKSHRALGENEFNKIISEVPSKGFLPLRDAVVLRMLWDTGVRVSELCDLDTSQISEDKRTAVIQTKKTGQLRLIVWSDHTHELLLRYLTERMCLNKGHSTALFVGWNKNRKWSLRLHPRSVQRIVKHYAMRAGVNAKLSPHSFRHGWAHKRRDQHAPLAFIQRGLGHVSPVSTFIYEQYNDKEFETNAKTFLKAA